MDGDIFNKEKLFKFLSEDSSLICGRKKTATNKIR